MNKHSLLAAASLLGGIADVSELNPVKLYKPVDHAKQNTWYRKVMQRPQRSRHTRTKRGRK